MVKTPAEKWKQDISIYRKKCQQILLISKSIRYVGLINDYGRTLTGIIKPGINILLKSEPARNEFFVMSTLLSMRCANERSIGSLDFAMFKHNKVTVLVFQRKEGTYYVSVNKELTLNPLTKIINKIKMII